VRRTEVAVVGVGPAGLAAALAAAGRGARVCLLDDAARPGGQLIKQTHMFFGSHRESAGVRGIDIAVQLAREAEEDPNCELRLNTNVLGYYSDGTLLLQETGGGSERVEGLRADAVVVCTGASERVLPFPNNDLPGIYGAGAVQTLMNVHGVRPGRRVLMVGAGNIGLIVSYQLLQAGVEVAAIVEALPRIGGYWVHGAKVRRAGVPILTSHSVVAAHGGDCLEAATICRLDEQWRPVAGTERRLEVDVMCLATGLSPLAELLWQAGCEMTYIAELGGHVALRGPDLETTLPGVFVAGDVAGIEEASTAMLEGRLAGLAAARYCGHSGPDADRLTAETRGNLAELRRAPITAAVRRGLEEMERRWRSRAAAAEGGATA